MILAGWLLVVMAAITFAVWQGTRSTERTFEQSATVVFDAIRDRALVAETAIEGFAAFVTPQSPLDHDATADFARRLLDRYPFLYKFEVAQQIPHAERPALVQRLAEIYPNFELRSFDYDGKQQWRNAPIASSYFPIVFQEPYFSDERKVVGLDLFSSRLLLDAMSASFREGLPVASRPFVLAEGATGYVIHRALDGGPATAVPPLKARRYALLALRADRFIGDIVDEHPELTVTVTYPDDRQHPEEPLLFAAKPKQPSATAERLLLPRFQRSVSLRRAVPSQPFQIDVSRQMTLADLDLPLLIGLLFVAAAAPWFARRFALTYFEHRLAGLDSEGILYQMANFDALTGVANRHRLMEQLEITLLRAQRDGTGFCLLFVDIDDFKTINDRLGHAAGDAVLVEFCERLRTLLRSDETLGRLGGDEFVLLTGETARPINIEALTRRVVDETRQPLMYGKQAIPIDISIGHACYPADGQNAAALLDTADRRMYRDKQRHHDGPQISPG
jgi:diguanylate cyclase (GGDEF)-like protein